MENRGVSVTSCTVTRFALTWTRSQVFCPFGNVLRIASFYKGGLFKAFIEYEDVRPTHPPHSLTARYFLIPVCARRCIRFAKADVADAARAALDGQHVYNGCNRLSVAYSKFSSLSVKVRGHGADDANISCYAC